MSTKRLFVTSLVSVLLLTACEEDTCPTSEARITEYKKAVSPFEKSGSKVLLSNKNRGRLQSLATDSKIKKGTKLSVAVYESCAVNNDFAISSQLNIRKWGALSKSKSPVDSYIYQVPRTMRISELEAMAQSDFCVKGISRRVKIRTSENFFSDPSVSRWPHLKSIRLTKGDGWGLIYGDIPVNLEDVIVAVIDTGIDVEHSDLRANLWTNSAELHGVEGVDDDGNGYVDDIYGYNFMDDIGDPSHRARFQSFDHGTHVAGLAAEVGGNDTGGAGVAPKGVKIMSLNVFGSEEYTYDEYVDRAIYYAADNGASVINMSLGGIGRADTTAEAIAYAINRGVTVVVAAGNSNKNIDNTFYTPASYARDFEGMLAVAATNERTRRYCSFTNYGVETVNISAPGCSDGYNGRPFDGIISTRAENSYGRMAGTSMASPLVAGAASLVYLHGVNKSGAPPNPAQVESMITEFSHSEKGLMKRVKNGAHLDMRLIGHELAGLERPEPCLVR